MIRPAKTVMSAMLGAALILMVLLLVGGLAVLVLTLIYMIGRLFGVW